jgi:hypothetical protein
MIYVNIDLETTGPSPDKNAILQIGAVAHDSSTWTEVGHFSGNVAIPANREWSSKTRLWWETNEEAGKDKLDLMTRSPWSTDWVIKAFFDWLLFLPNCSKTTTDDRRIAFVANPISYDMPFLHSYMREYVGAAWEEWVQANEVGFGGIDLPTLAMCVMGASASDKVPAYPDARRRKWPERWVSKDLPHTHIAIDDARHQAFAFICMMRELEEIRSKRPL